MRQQYLHALRQTAGFALKLVRVVTLSDRDFARFIAEIEADPLFRRLASAGGPAPGAIRYHRLARTALSRRFLSLDEAKIGSASSPSSAVEVLLEKKRKLLDAARAVGEEKFARYFIYAEGPLLPDDIARECGLAAGVVREIIDLVNAVNLYDEFAAPPAAPQQVPFNKVASIVMNAPGEYELHFTSLHWVRGVYIVDRDAVERLKNGDRLTADEKTRLPELFRKIEQANARTSTVVKILQNIIGRQKRYLDAGGEDLPAPYPQKVLAAEIGVHPSVVCRGIAGRSVELPWGKETAIKELLPQEKKAPGACAVLLRLLDDEKQALAAGKILQPYSDRELSALLNRDHATAVAPRTVALYRALLRIPGSYRRKPR